MSEIHYGKCVKCNCMGGLNNHLVCLSCVDEKKLLNKTVKERNALLEKQINGLLVENGKIKDWLIVFSKGMDEHPEDFDYDCGCNLCLSYADNDGEEG